MTHISKFALPYGRGDYFSLIHWHSTEFHADVNIVEDTASEDLSLGLRGGADNGGAESPDGHCKNCHASSISFRDATADDRADYEANEDERVELGKKASWKRITPSSRVAIAKLTSKVGHSLSRGEPLVVESKIG